MTLGDLMERISNALRIPVRLGMQGPSRPLPPSPAPAPPVAPTAPGEGPAAR